jgi:hypothetical protein
VAKSNKDFKAKNESRTRKKSYKKVGGYQRFIISWDRGFMTRRAISHLRTVLEWLNYYELLKKYEIDHKRASGSYLWSFSFEDVRMFKQWLALSDEDRRKTGIMAKKTPGGSIILPPGVKMEVINPQLGTISEEDTDILQMITAGLNEPADVTTGSAKGTFASIKASRGPMSDRTSDEISTFDSFLKYDFWGSIFFLKSSISGFPATIKVKMATEFDDNGKPVFRQIKRKPEQLLEISYPVSESLDLDTRMKLLGVKHSSIMDSLGIPAEDAAKKLGYGAYQRARLRRATEEETMPKLQTQVDAEAAQEKKLETPKPTSKPSPKKPATE